MEVISKIKAMLLLSLVDVQEVGSFFTLEIEERVEFFALVA